MSTLAPSLYCLFRRSRYHRCEIVDDAGGSRVETEIRSERERFAAAAVAFCLKQSPAFRGHFWRKICRFGPKAPDLPALQIEVEPHHWADLRLKTVNRRRQAIYVIEFKLDSELAAKQNPTDSKSFLRKKVGYGALFSKAHPQSAVALRYVTLGSRKLPSGEGQIPGASILWRACKWSDLMVGAPSGDNLVDDLFESLANLGVSCFRMKEVKKIQVSSNLAPAADAWDLLTILGSEDVCDFRSAYWRISAGRNGKDQFHMGAYLEQPPPKKNTSTIHRTLARLNPSGHALLWVGYEGGQGIPEGFRRSVWFYCSDKQCADMVRKRVKSTIRDAMTSLDRDGDWCAVVTSGTKSKMADLEWFENVIKSATR